MNKISIISYQVKSKHFMNHPTFIRITRVQNVCVDRIRSTITNYVKPQPR